MPIQNNQMPRITGHGFKDVPGPELQRSTFDRSFQVKGTITTTGYLIPILMDEVYPGDHFKCQTQTFFRLATGLTPFMDDLYLDVHYWYVRTRLLWTNFNKFMGEQVNPGDSIDYKTPKITLPVGGVTNSSLSDYLGLPPGIAPGATLKPLAFYHRAYNFTWNLAYRDQNLQNSVAQHNDDGPDAETDYVLLRRGKRHDYFASCLPWPQKGSAVTLPLGNYANVISNDSDIKIKPVSGSFSDGTLEYITGPGRLQPTVDTGSSPPVKVHFDSTFTGLKTDLSTATATTIEQVRESFTLQQFLERDARGGTRLNEITKNHFGVTVPDSYYRPEYIGGGTVALKQFVIPQTSATGATGTPQGNLASYATASHSGIGFNHSFDEHGVILGLLSIRQRYTYQQGIAREYWRDTRYDYYWPTFANLGEQAVYNREIYYAGNDTQDATPFGYNERWSELRYKPSMIVGEFRSSFAQTLDSWHLAQYFTSLPTLGSTFIVENPPVDRVVAVEAPYPQWIFDVAHSYYCTRPLPIFSVPGLHRM